MPTYLELSTKISHMTLQEHLEFWSKLFVCLYKTFIMSELGNKDLSKNKINVL